VNPMDGYGSLRSHSLFGGMDDGDMRKITSLLKPRRFERGKLIIREGETNDTLYFIREGEVEILKRVPAGGPKAGKRIAVLSRGDAFGEMELIDIQPSPATVRTLRRTDVLTLSNTDLYGISKWNLKTYTLIIMNLAREISRRLRRMDELYVNALYAAERESKVIEEES